MFSCSKNEKEKQLSESTVTETVESKPSIEVQPENKSIAQETKPISKSSTKETLESKPKVKEIKVTFIELGSVGCIPCKMMQPIMKEIEEEYKDQVKVIFYDVWTEEGRQYAQKYRIRVIPTQVFLDKDGNEYFRHEGFFPKEELVKILKMKGIQ
jgi:thioredoxin 1